MAECYDGTVKFFDSDAQYMRSVEAERISVAAPVGKYFSHRKGAGVDPLYDEPVPWYYYEYSFPILLKYADVGGRTKEASDEGVMVFKNATATVAASSWESSVGTVRKPSEGDVVLVRGRWFDVVGASEAGYVLGSNSHTSYKLELSSRSPFTPDRKIVTVAGLSFSMLIGTEASVAP